MRDWLLMLAVIAGTLLGGILLRGLLRGTGRPSRRRKK